MNSKFLVLLSLILGCSGDGLEETGSLPPDDTGVEPDELPPWVVQGEFGQVVLVRARDARGRASVEGYAAFGNDFQGFASPALCAVSDRACLTAIPEPGERLVAERFRQKQVEWRWVGDDLRAGAVTLNAVHDVDAGVFGYVRAADSAASPGSTELHLEGEWPAVSVSLPAAPAHLELLSPAPGEAADLSTGKLNLAWTPGEGQLMLVAKGLGGTVVIGLEDDGEQAIDLADLPEFGPDGAELELVRWVEQTVQVGGNQLSLVSMSVAGVYASECANPPSVKLAAQAPVGSMTTPGYYGVGLEGVMGFGGIEDFVLDGTPTSARAIVSFYDYSLNYLCQVSFDLTDSPPVAGATAVGGLPLFWTAQVDVRAEGATDCGRVNYYRVPTGDLRDFVRDSRLAIGLGGKRQVIAPLRDFYGAQWSAYESLYMGAFMNMEGGTELRENSYGIVTELASCSVADLEAGAISVPPTGPVPVGYVYAGPLFLDYL